MPPIPSGFAVDVAWRILHTRPPERVFDLWLLQYFAHHWDLERCSLKLNILVYNVDIIIAYVDIQGIVCTSSIWSPLSAIVGCNLQFLQQINEIVNLICRLTLILIIG